MSTGQDMSVQEKLKGTLNLPTTNFPIRPQAVVDDPALLVRWQKEGLYSRATELNRGKAQYILHDGPPYANGHIHLGHAYNKILKDVITKAYRMAGYHVPVVPGWDCHGLPIEFKVTQEQKNLTPLAIKEACRKYAQGWIDIQREEFKQLGVIMDWDQPYITMDHRYEAATLRAFGNFVEQGFIERKNKTVAWCTTCTTTLASAEIEYQDRKDPSLYVAVPLLAAEVRRLAEKHAALRPYVDEQISFVIWTTTPWTLPLNRAVALHPRAQYILVKLNEKLLFMSEAAANKLAQELQAKPDFTGYTQEAAGSVFLGESFAGTLLEHPIVPGVTVPVILEDAVATDEGTAAVHCAPGCGPVDYEWGVKHGLEIYSPVTADGRYTEQVVPTSLSGVAIADAQGQVITMLQASGRLVAKGSLRHSYPHCWRCRNGLIFRATPQWFFDLQKNGVQVKALAAADTIKFTPERGSNFLRATVGNRWEWCLSRQRSWGVPIPALVCLNCDHAWTSGSFIETIAAEVAQRGIEYWDEVPVANLIEGKSCERCKGTEFRKERDILDVWFDSGVSHYAVLRERADLRFPADLYLEGIDQYRGWFQSSLLTSLALTGEAPMKAIMAHGFTVDEQGRKMSKSLGNGVEPKDIIAQLGTDGLRLWVASIGNESDAVVSASLLRNVGEVYRKIRNTCRFLLQNIYDFDAATDLVAPEKLLLLDRMALAQLARLNSAVIADYQAGNLTSVFHALSEYCSVQLSALYLDMIKDRLYVAGAKSHERRSAQTVVWYQLDTLTRLAAPILSFMAEQLADHYQKEGHISIHLQGFANLASMTVDNGQVWEECLQALRSAVLKAVEVQREQGVIKHSLEAQVVLAITPEFAHAEALDSLSKKLEKQGETLVQFLQEYLIVSQVILHKDTAGLVAVAPGVLVAVAKAAGTKCPRCWHWEVTKHQHGLCKRCAQLVVL